MSTTRAFSLLLFSFFATTAIGSAASSLAVSVSGVFDSSIAAGPLAAPNEPFSISFIMSTNPVVTNSTSTGFDVPFSSFRYTLNNTTVNMPAQYIEFFTGSSNGLLTFFFGPQSGYQGTTPIPEFEFDGPQAFTGTTSNPVFSAGSFTASDWIYSDASNYDQQTVSNSIVRLAPVPEPSTLYLLVFAVGIALAGRFGYQRFASSTR